MADRSIIFRTLDERTEPAIYVDATLRVVGRFIAVFIDGHVAVRGRLTNTESIEWHSSTDLDRTMAIRDHAFGACFNR